MKQKFFIFFGVIVIIGLLIGLNAASLSQKEKEADREIFPNRSTYNTGATGTRAFYDLLSETGRKVTRWQEPPSKLSNQNQNTPSVFVIIGQTRREISDTDAQNILDWTADGGTLVLIDRAPVKDLVTSTANWQMSLSYPSESLTSEIDPANSNQMTDKTNAAKPVQPSIFTSQINAVQPSRFAGTVNFERYADAEIKIEKIAEPPKVGEIFSEPDSNLPKIEERFFQANSNSQISDDNRKSFKLQIPQVKPPPPKPAPTGGKNKPVESVDAENTDEIKQTAPVVHLSNGEKNILVDVPYGSGRIIFLSDPFIVSNGGINLVDNAQIGINTVSSNGGIIAFDEYHQGFGVNDNRLFQYFAGTPVFPIIGQIILLVGLIFFSQSRRFARPLPADEPNRLSKLEYVAAMAELQQRTKGYDLAIENIYTEFRRRASRLLGVDNQSTSSKDFAKLLSERSNCDELKIYNLVRNCEDIMHGEATNKKTVLKLTGELRGIEEKLGLRRTGRKI
ncbi:MAG: DUF4350 domain-containing protein [Pyrinomonadaceae bacterium]